MPDQLVQGAGIQGLMQRFVSEQIVLPEIFQSLGKLSGRRTPRLFDDDHIDVLLLNGEVSFQLDALSRAQEKIRKREPEDAVAIHGK